MRNIVAGRITAFANPVIGVRFIKCYWPKFDRPTAIFPKGSSGIRVRGSTRNIVFPGDTVFESWYPDADFPAEQATIKRFPHMGRFIELTEEQGDFYVAEHVKATAAIIAENRNATIFQTVAGPYYLRHHVHLTERRGDFLKYIAPLSEADARAIVAGNVDVDALKQQALFVVYRESLDKPDTLAYRIAADKAAVEEVAMIGVLQFTHGDDVMLARPAEALALPEEKTVVADIKVAG